MEQNYSDILHTSDPKNYENKLMNEPDYIGLVDQYARGALNHEEESIRALVRLSGEPGKSYETDTEIASLITSASESAKSAQRAYELAKQHHSGQVDKAGKPYITHPVTVAGYVSNFKEIICALLHDTVEDTDLTLSDIDREFGPEIAAAIEALTHRKGEPYMDYVKRAAQNPIAIRVKLADLKNNMDLTRIENPTEADYRRVREKYEPARAYLKSILGE